MNGETVALYLVLVLIALAAAAAHYVFERARVPMRIEHPERVTAHAGRAVARFGLPAAVLGLSYLACQITWLRGPAALIHVIVLVLVFVACLGTIIVLVPLVLYAVVRKHARGRVARFVLGTCTMGSTAALVFSAVSWHQERQLREYCEAMEPIARGLEAFEQDQRALPDSLAQLVPRYLPAIPERRIPALMALEYRVIPAADTLRTMLRYDLRPRETSEYEFGVPQVLGRADATGRIVEIRLINDEGRAGTEVFVSRVWRDSVSARLRMAKHVSRMFDESATLDDVLARLGPPDERWVLREPRWQLQTEVEDGIGTRVLVRASSDGPPSDLDQWDPQRIARWWKLRSAD
ncbi:MAG: hypothetical protein IT348_20315 [Candidatus Eisenbacteria bacterium]|nr:hypothetical protein [Candidatus Eisenbacteria bacterium]